MDWHQPASPTSPSTPSPAASSALPQSKTVYPQREPKRTPPKRSKLPTYRTILYTLNISARFLIAGLFGRGSIGLADRLLRWWAGKIYRSGNAGLEVVGLERLEPGKAYIYMSNHASLLDVPTMYLAVPGSLRAVLKQELLKVPVWGQALVATGFVPVDRGNTKKAIEQMELAKKRLAEGVSMWVLPEGTRTRTGELLPFKKGGFHLALQLEAEIVPIWLEGTAGIIPPDSFVANYDRMAQAVFGDPIDCSGKTPDDIPEMIEEVRARMLELRDEGRAVTAALAGAASEDEAVSEAGLPAVDQLLPRPRAASSAR